MASSVFTHVQLTKQALFDHSGMGLISQTGGEVVQDDFALPALGDLITTLPSIEMFVVSMDGTIAAMGSNEALNAGWLPSVEALAALMRRWANEAGVIFGGDAYVTASITQASEVNGEAHFDDDQFDPTAGSGLVAIVGDIDGPRVASGPIPHDEIAAPRPVVVDEVMVGAFANGEILSTSYEPNQVVALPQFAQLHAGPGPCGGSDEVRHLLVYRVATTAR